MCEIENENAKVKDKSGDANDEKVAACQLENLAMKYFRFDYPFFFSKESIHVLWQSYFRRPTYIFPGSKIITMFRNTQIGPTEKYFYQLP